MLVNQLARKKPWGVACAGFNGVNTPIMADCELPVRDTELGVDKKSGSEWALYHWAGIDWLSVGSRLLGGGIPTPLLATSHPTPAVRPG